jgi:hypothetical protein
VRAGYLRALRFGSEAPVNCLADTIGAACDNRLDCELVITRDIGAPIMRHVDCQMIVSEVAPCRRGRDRDEDSIVASESRQFRQYGRATGT